MLYLTVHTSLFGLFAGVSGFSLFAPFFGMLDEGVKSLQGFFPVSFVGPVVLGLYDNHPISGKATVAQVEQPAFDSLGQAGVHHIKVQLDGGGDFIDILPTGPLCSNLGYGYFPSRYGDGWMYCYHNNVLLGNKSFLWDTGLLHFKLALLVPLFLLGHYRTDRRGVVIEYHMLRGKHYPAGTRRVNTRYFSRQPNFGASFK